MSARPRLRVLLQAVAMFWWTRAAAQAPDSARRPMTVADIIQLTTFGSRTATCRRTSMSRPRTTNRLHAVVVKRDDVERNTNVFSLLISRTHAPFAGPKPDTVLTLACSSNRPAIGHVRWLTDNHTVTFLGEHPGALPQIYALDLKTRQLSKRTGHATEITSYVELVVSVLGVDVGGTQPDRAGLMGVGLTNQLAPLAGATLTAGLGVRRVITGTADSFAGDSTFDIQVDSGTTSLRVAVQPVSDSLVQVDIYLFDCTSGSWFLWDVDFVHGRRAELLVHNPRPGKWKAVVDPARIPSSSAGFTYTEVVTNPKYGTLVLDSTPTPRATGAQWTGQVSMQPAPAPPIAQRRELVLVTDVVDQAAEREERDHPLAEFGGAPYRPVALGTAIVPIR